MDSHSLSYEIVNAVIRAIDNKHLPQVISIDPIALEIQQILDQQKPEFNDGAFYGERSN